MQKGPYETFLISLPIPGLIWDGISFGVTSRLLGTWLSQVETGKDFLSGLGEKHEDDFS